MLESIKMWIITILIGAVIINLVDMILPDSKLKPYITLVTNFIFVFIILTPIISIFSKDVSFEDKVLQEMGKYNKEYVDSYNKLSQEVGNEELEKGYEDGLKSVLTFKLQEYGYELDDIEFDGSNINNIKIKEKSNTSNNEENEDIQYSRDEESKEVFENTDQEQELDLDTNELKNDLIKILDVSIETIEINK